MNTFIDCKQIIYLSFMGFYLHFIPLVEISIMIEKTLVYFLYVVRYKLN